MKDLGILPMVFSAQAKFLFEVLNNLNNAYYLVKQKKSSGMTN